MKKVFVVITIILCMCCVLTACNNTHVHEWGTYVDYDETCHYKICKENNTHIESEAHTYGEGSVIIEPTETTSGYMEYKCIYCGRKKVEEIKTANSHEYNKCVINDKYIKEKVSNATTLYYKSCECGECGDEYFAETTIPNEYSELYYIETDGTAFIDTGIALTDNSKVVTKYDASPNLLTDEQSIQNITSSKYGIGEMLILTSVEPNSTYTLSVCGRTNATCTSEGYLITFLFVLDKNNEWVWSEGISIKETNDTIKSKTFTTPNFSGSNYTYCIYSYYYPEESINDGGSATLNWYMFTEGEIVIESFDTIKNYSYDKTGVYMNETLLTSNIMFDTTNNFCMFGDNTPFASKNRSRLYACTIYDGENIVRDLIPVKRDADGAVGLYDLITKMFYTATNKPTGIIAGEVAKTPDVSVPDDYEVLENIDSNDGIYIDTGISDNAKWVLDAKFAVNNTRQLMGYRGQGAQYFGVQADNCYGVYKENSRKATILAGNRDEIIFDYKNEDANLQKLYINGTLCVLNNVENEDTAGNTFTIGNLNALIYPCDCTIYSLKCYKGDELIGSFVPVHKKTTDEYGLYDTVNNRFCKDRKNDSDSFIIGSYVENDDGVPDTFSQLEYIESTGSQNVVLDIVANSDMKISADFAMTNLTKTSAIWCARKEMTEESTTVFYIANKGLRFDYGIDVTNDQLDKLLLNTKTNITMEKNNLYIDGELKSTALYEKYTSSSINLFSSICDNDRDTLGNYSYIKMYSFKVWDGEDLICDLVPVERKADCKVGLYDKITKSFYVDTVNTNGDFSAGAYVENALLPDDYYGLNYITSNGTQYIKTGVLQTNKVTVDCHFSTGNAVKNYMFGSRQNSSAMMYNGLYCNNVLEYNYTELSFAESDDIIMTQKIVGDDTSITINGVTSVVATGTAEGGEIYIGACLRNNGTLRPYGTMQIYYFKISDNNRIVRDFVPAERKVDGARGLYDKVSGRFYVDAINNGNDFSADSYVENELLPDEYYGLDSIKSSGKEYIDTGLLKSNYPDIKWVMDCQFSTVIGEAHMGAFGNNSRLHLGCWSNSFCPGISNGYSASKTFDYNRHVLTLDVPNNLFLIDGVSYPADEWTASPTSTTLPNVNLYLFARNDNGTATCYCNATIYSCKIYNGDLLIRDFVPAERKIDGKVGLYDLVEDVFYTNSASNNEETTNSGIIAGEEVLHKYDEGTVVKDATYDEGGEIVYKCSICGKEKHEFTNPLAYKVTFKVDEGVECVKIYYGLAPDEYNIGLVGYARNKNTLNVSRVNAEIRFEIILKDGYTLVQNGMALDSNAVMSLNINSDTVIKIKSKK